MCIPFVILCCIVLYAEDMNVHIRPTYYTV
jgi:hypothetical protein